MLLALCLPKPGLTLLAWFGLVPLLRRPGAREGLAAGFAFHVVALYWIYNTCRYGGLPVPAAALALAALSGVLAVNWALTGALLRRLPPSPLAYAAAWTAVAFLSERFTPRLAADLLEYTQWRSIHLLSLPAVAGPHALGFLIVLVNAALALRKQLWWLLVLPALAAHVFVPVGRLSPAGKSAAVSILQPNVDQYQKWDPGFAESIEANFRDLLKGSTAQLVVWPESALPYYVEDGVRVPGKGAQLVGAVTKRGETVRNSALLVEGGAVAAEYHKRRLVPFGEFIPIPYVERFIPILTEMGAITPGAEDQPLLDTPLGPAAVGICYEAVFPSQARRDAARGAQVLINITNDGWYKDTAGPYQHFYANVFRAVETGLPVVRAANTGISGVISPRGWVLDRLDLGVRGRLDAEVAGSVRPTPYVRFGDWLGWLCVLITCALFFRRATSLT